ncbi:hypothetical protein OHA21_27320 [Actinoplanes sp. NBC_00393]|uniref:hypothetical protein n=1 Tax=Actinoplanes sp. NBC_00393 TaxID=2975953 RepID=UPI002E1B9AC5
MSVRLRRPGVWLGAVAGMLAAIAVPAVAVAAPQLTVQFPNVTLLPGGAAETQWNRVENNDTGVEFTLHDVKITIDATKVAGVATPKLLTPAGCTTAGAVYTCIHETLPTPEDYSALRLPQISYTPVGAVGAEGTVTLTLTSRETGTVNRTATVAVAEAVALAAEGEQYVRGAQGEPGDTVSLHLDGVRNIGEKAITGVDLSFPTGPKLDMAKRYSNCEYGTTAAYCHFDTELQPGTAYALAEDMTARLAADLPAPGNLARRFMWLTPADNRDNVDRVRAENPKRGTDGPLTLVAKPAAKSLPQTDTGGKRSWQDVLIAVRGQHKAQLAAIGAEADGAVGSTVQVEVGIENLGPASVYDVDKIDENVTASGYMPEGTTIVEAADGCRFDAKNKRYYICAFTGDLFRAEASATWPFTVRIDRAGTLTGQVVASTKKIEPTLEDDTADIVINATAGGTGGTGGGGTLPITGAPIGMVAGAGVLLLVGGAAAYLIGRRRRADFTA